MDISSGIQGAAASAATASRLAERANELQQDGGGAEAAQRFEELLATLLVKEMRKALPDGLFGDGPGADVYEGWFDEHLGRSLARDGGLGLAETVRESLVRKAASIDAQGGV